MGKVLVTALIENQSDLFLVERGTIPPEQVRRVEVQDAVADPGAIMLWMPKRMIDRLGLEPRQTRCIRTSAGPRMARLYGFARLTIMGRDCPIDVAELAEDGPVVIGMIPLHSLDFVVDPIARRVIGNPAHGGQWIEEIYGDITTPAAASSRSVAARCWRPACRS
jgi:hypothetical protein